MIPHTVDQLVPTATAALAPSMVPHTKHQNTPGVTPQSIPVATSEIPPIVVTATAEVITAPTMTSPTVQATTVLTPLGVAHVQYSQNIPQPMHTTDLVQQPTPTATEHQDKQNSLYCRDVKFSKCKTYRTDLKCCRNTDKCTGWGNCKCASTSCCKTTQKAEDHDRQVTDSGSEYHGNCKKDGTSSKCESYSSDNCCKAGTDKMWGLRHIQMFLTTLLHKDKKGQRQSLSSR
ncbi:hypothetical protein SARC_08165 [Sphaeroforma arctica JP610]|uniref:Uncharacterized protein n=1 Tax=Sphaeroforma arctica JP610 TaxID=667725 RepID=A0A0L0FRW2_9EUKA|nr:hypothetical protein SARC_08165 [Sphaeroforma arctica JP610]KNC79434.1 hypothetical protein SARC_08165 [Sphaeroforma arctica JP610]|eukprot:XP_014153336.1 hypothetical protein SARC_08165 [Sphaeroforma arctica JP610]